MSAVEARLLEPEARRGTGLRSAAASPASSASILAEMTTQPAPSAFARSRDLRREGVAGRGRRLVDVADVEDGLRRQELEGGVAPAPPRRSSFARRAGLPSRRSASAFSRSASCAFASLSPLLAFFSIAAARFSQALEVGEHQLGLDRLGVGDRIDAVLDVGDVGVLEAAQRRRRRRRPRGCGRGTGCRALRPWTRPRTRPAMSTKVSRVGMICADLAIAASVSSRSSGTADLADVGLDRAEGIIRGLAPRLSRSAH